MSSRGDESDEATQPEAPRPPTLPYDGSHEADLGTQFARGFWGVFWYLSVAIGAGMVLLSIGIAAYVVFVKGLIP